MTSLNMSNWIPDGPIKKREPTIRRSGAKVPSEDSDMPESIAETEENNKAMSSKVAQLLSKLSTDNDGNKLADYEPNYRPEMTVTKTDPIDMNPSSPPTKEPMTSKYSANDINLANLSNYNQTYSSPTVFQKTQPYYAKMGVSSSGDDKLMEKINYMIHLLEQQQMEKTANVTEEFILYMLLGVFVIFTVDSFTRAGKYVR
jgi:hypothetical protein